MLRRLWILWLVASGVSFAEHLTSDGGNTRGVAPIQTARGPFGASSCQPLRNPAPFFRSNPLPKSPPFSNPGLPVPPEPNPTPGPNPDPDFGPAPGDPDRILACENAGGTWTWASSGCGFCPSNGMVACTAVMTPDCYCGDEACFDGKVCRYESRAGATPQRVNE